MKPADIVVFLFVLFVTIGSFPLVYQRSAGEPMVHIESASGTEWLFPLTEERQIDVPGPVGITRVVIHSGKAAITESACANHLCVKMGFLSEPGHWAACLPNRVFVRITGDKEGEAADEQTDAHSY